VHLGLRLIEDRAAELDGRARVELLHAVACHHDARAARTAEASVLYHANQLDAVAATRPVPD
jgi:metal-dependent HD superfamily phosphatase/phosphodiesterase